jgi:hypothetical protein
MKGKLLVITAIIVVLVVASLSPLLLRTIYADPSQAPSSQATPANEATIDITINDSGGMSIGGIDLSTLGVTPLDPQVVNMIKGLQNVHLVVEGQEVNLDVQATPVVKVNWDPESRQTSANLAVRYGVQLTPEFQSRLEEWIATGNYDATVRYANELSNIASIALSKPVIVDIGTDGRLTVETLPLEAAVTPETVQMLTLGGKQVLACWNKGQLTTAIDGAELPTVTLNPEGVQVINEALSLNITQLKDPLLAARFGVDLSLPGGAHVPTAVCPE